MKIWFCPKCFAVLPTGMVNHCGEAHTCIAVTNLCPHEVNIAVDVIMCKEFETTTTHEWVTIPPDPSGPMRTTEEKINMRVPLPFKAVALRYHREDFPKKLYNHFYIVSLNVALLAWAKGRHDFVTVYRVRKMEKRSPIESLAEGLSFSPEFVFGKFKENT